MGCDLRRAEISDLKVEDIHDYKLSVVRGKGDKTREVYLDPKTRDVLMEYSRVRNVPTSPYLCTARKGKIT